MSSKGKRPIADLAKELTAPVTVATPAGPKKMSPYEAEIRALVERAFKGNMRAARKILDQAISAGPLERSAETEPERPYKLTIPKHWDNAEWHKMFDELGYPPWPGEDDGLVDAQREAWTRWTNAQ